MKMRLARNCWFLFHAAMIVVMMMMNVVHGQHNNNKMMIGAPPATPVWPSQWQAEVMIADTRVSNDNNATTADYLPIGGVGNYYYDSTTSTSAFVYTIRPTGAQMREVVGNVSQSYIISSEGGACKIETASNDARLQTLPTNFLSMGKFKFIGYEYYSRDNVFYETYHWSGFFPANSSLQLDYWHAVKMDAPYRLTWGTSPPVVLEFINVEDNLPAPHSAIFNVPTNCKQQIQSDSITTIDDDVLSHNNVKATPPKGKAWPSQWHASANYTGNDLGLFATPDDIIGEPTTVAISLYGTYYYDWINLRECNVWTDVKTGAPTKTLIINGTFHLVNLVTKSCKIIPTSPVNGPLNYTWPTNLPYADEEQVLSGDATHYTLTHHYMFDAFGVGQEHSFNYWEMSGSQSPVQFQGPVLDFFPYGQSMMSWSNFVPNLDGVNVDEIFWLPDDCKKIPEEEFKTLPEYPMAQLHISLYNTQL